MSQKIIFNFLEVLSAIALLVVTAVYVGYTKNMAETMHSQFSQNNRPYVFLDTVKWDYSEKIGPKIIFPIRNSGSVPARIDLKEVCYFENNEKYCSDEGETFVFPGAKNIGFTTKASFGEKVINLVKKTEKLLSV